MRLVHYNFSSLRRISNPEGEKILNDRRPLGYLRFWAIHPKDGGESQRVDPEMETTLEDLLKTGHSLFQGDAFLANEIMEGRSAEYNTWPITSKEDFRPCRHRRTFYCHCGCGAEEYSTNDDYSEIMEVIPSKICKLCGSEIIPERDDCPICGNE